MKLHLVFDPATSEPLSAALQRHGYEVSGTDATLEQFALAAEAGQITADIAIVDVTAGIVHKADSVRFLRAVRGDIPDTRLIVILPVEADEAWINEVGALGIYDVYAVEQFAIEDILVWIEIKRTIRDLGEQKSGLNGKVPGRKMKLVPKEARRSFLDSFRKKGARREWIEDEDLMDMDDAPDAPRVIYKTKIIGSSVVAVGGAHRRAGTTHTAIQLAVLLMRSGLKTALLEYRAADNHESDLVWIKPDDAGETSFEMDGIEFYQACKSIGEVISRGHDAVVIDAGTLDEPAALDEWRRAAVRIITISAAPWDVGRAKLSEFAADQAAIVVNYATQGMYETVYELLKHLEKPIVHNRGGYDPFSPDLSLVPIVSTLLPEKRRRKVF